MKGDFVRPALQRGLRIGQEYGINPYQFGLIGSTDSHTGLSSPQENNFQGQEPKDSIPANKAQPMGDEGSPTGWDFSASGMAAVWAQDNTREAILQAFKRREVYATTGPRIAVRFDGGWYPPLAESAAAQPSDAPTHCAGITDLRSHGLRPARRQRRLIACPDSRSAP